MKKITYFKINGQRDTIFGLWLFIIGSFWIICLLWGWFTEELNMNNWGYLLILIIVTIFCWIPFYFGLYVVSIKSLQINGSGIQYLINNKIKNEILWQNIEEVRGVINGKNYVILIKSNNTKIEFDNNLHNVSIQDLKEAYNEILKYQPKYRFKIVKDVN